jgi:ferric-dicitrate binding protein FerR (iron transport regulator)
VYFDSLASAADPASAEFAIQTDNGVIRHIGTQYMASVTASGVTVNVREGQVRILADTFDATAAAGQQVRVQGSARPAYANIRTHGELWHWAEKFTPTLDVDGQSAHQFINWAARESGLKVRFANDDVEALAHDTHMSGDTGELEPKMALQVLLQITTLEATFADDSILVSAR